MLGLRDVETLKATALPSESPQLGERQVEKSLVPMPGSGVETSYLS